MLGLFWVVIYLSSCCITQYSLGVLVLFLHVTFVDSPWTAYSVKDRVNIMMLSGLKTVVVLGIIMLYYFMNNITHTKLSVLLAFQTDHRRLQHYFFGALSLILPVS